jgi:DNA polymerase III subunit alpha
LRHLLMSYPGDCRTQLYLTVDRKSEAVIALSPKLQVNPSPAFFQEMAQHFGRNSAVPVYKACSQR